MNTRLKHIVTGAITAFCVTACSTAAPVPTASMIGESTDSVTYTELPTDSNLSSSVIGLPETQAPPQVQQTSRPENGGSQLPCWLAICPGRTEWRAAVTSLRQLDEDVVIGDLDRDGLYVVGLPDQENEGTEPLEKLAPRYGVASGLVQMIDVSPAFDLHYPILAVFKDHGSPTEIWVRLEHGSASDTKAFTLVMIYGNKGIAAAYRLPAYRTNNGSSIVTCMDPIDPSGLVRLVLWDPQNNQTLTEVISQSTLAERGDPYLPMDEAMGVSIDQLYASETRMSGRGGCMTSPTSLWP